MNAVTPLTWTADDRAHRSSLAGGRAVLIRRVAVGDEGNIQRFVAALSAQSRYQRFFIPLRELTHTMLERVVQFDDMRGAALLAFSGERPAEPIALAQYDIVGPGEAEAAVIVGEGWRRIGLATALLRHLQVLAAAAGIRRVRADILRDNAAALTLARQLGCVVEPRSGEPYAVQVVRQLHPPRQSCDPSTTCANSSNVAARPA